MPRDAEGEESEPNAYDLRLLKRLVAYAKPYRTSLLLAFACNVLVASLGPLRPYLTKIALDDHVVSGDYQGLLGIIAILFATLVVQAGGLYGLTFLMQYMGQHIIHDIRVRLHRHVTGLDLSYFDHTPVGRTVTRLTNDVDALNDLFSSGLVMIVSDLLVVFWLLIFMLILNWQLALITLLIVPLLVYATMLFRAKARQAFRDVRQHLASLNSFMQEHIAGIGVVQLFARERQEADKFAATNAEYRQATVRTVFYYALYFPFVEILSAVAIALILLYGGYGARRGPGGVSIGEIAAFIQFAEMFFRPIYDLSNKYNILQSAMASSERIFDLLDTPPVVEARPEDAIPLETVTGQIEFDNVSFSYDEGNPILKNISFAVAPGETVAIVGASGAGKTTIARLLRGFYELDEGRILIDGKDLRQLDPQEVRRHIGAVSQDVFIFAGRIDANISLGDPQLDDADIRRAATSVGADKFIEQLPGGYAEEVAEGGLSLSAGQRQLLAFARAMAYRPDVLVLDEATSNVDSQSEQHIQHAVERLLANRSAIVIAHRLSTIRNASKIIVLHHGEIREAGGHEELLAQRGIYYRLYQLQYQEQEPAVPGQ